MPSRLKNHVILTATRLVTNLADHAINDECLRRATLVINWNTTPFKAEKLKKGLKNPLYGSDEAFTATINNLDETLKAIESAKTLGYRLIQQGVDASGTIMNEIKVSNFIGD